MKCYSADPFDIDNKQTFSVCIWRNKSVSIQTTASLVSEDSHPTKILSHYSQNKDSNKRPIIIECIEELEKKKIGSITILKFFMFAYGNLIMRTFIFLNGKSGFKFWVNGKFLKALKWLAEYSVKVFELGLDRWGKFSCL